MMEIIYASAQSQPFSPMQLTDLLSRARQHNRAVGVTGLLLYHRGSFLQVLEGEELAVNALCEKIAKDKRHHRFMVIKRSTVSERAFQEWSMGFGEVTPSVARKLDGFSSFLQQGVLDEAVLADQARAEQVRKVLHSFRSGDWRQRLN